MSCVGSQVAGPCLIACVPTDQAHVFELLIQREGLRDRHVARSQVHKERVDRLGPRLSRSSHRRPTDDYFTSLHAALSRVQGAEASTCFHGSDPSSLKDREVPARGATFRARGCVKPRPHGRASLWGIASATDVSQKCSFLRRYSRLARRPRPGDTTRTGQTVTTCFWLASLDASTCSSPFCGSSIGTFRHRRTEPDAQSDARSSTPCAAPPP